VAGRGRIGERIGVGRAYVWIMRNASVSGKAGVGRMWSPGRDGYIGGNLGGHPPIEAQLRHEFLRAEHKRLRHGESLLPRDRGMQWAEERARGGGPNRPGPHPAPLLLQGLRVHGPHSTRRLGNREDPVST
jgi:hypothetical protein